MSKSFSVDTTDLLSVAKNALLVGVAAVLTYIGENISSIDLGSATALVVPVVVVAINTAVKWVKDSTTKK